jgi:hypothetical protein
MKEHGEIMHQFFLVKLLCVLAILFVAISMTAIIFMRDFSSIRYVLIPNGILIIINALALLYLNDWSD